jgi:16S rRNA (uracil1498-N3)-methyltransferase
MTRFFVEPEELLSQSPVLTGENASHAKVLRLKAGEEILLCDGQGQEALCRVMSTEFDLEVLERRISSSEAAVRVSVYMALPKADKLEHVIQKATELGAYEIVTFPTSRCVSRPDEKSLKKKLERWQKIAASASEQSGRGRIPEVVVLDSYAKALARGAEADLPIVFYENEHATTLRQALSSKAYTTVSILSGPEGGFEEAEIQKAREAGFRICTLGKRILRCETAPLCGLSAVMYDAGEF